MSSFPFDQNIANSLSFLQLGFRADRATATLPQTSTSHLFTVTVGRVLVNLMVGGVTTIIQSSDPVAKITATPTTGSAVDIASTTALTSLEVGGWIGVSGDGTALVVNNAGASLIGAKPCFFMVNIGTIDLITGASKTGSVKWTCWWLPIDDGALLVAS